MSSSLSLRSFGRLGSRASVLDFFDLGSSLSVRSFVRMGSTLSVFASTTNGTRTKLRIGAGSIEHIGRTTAAVTSPNVEMFANKDDNADNPSLSLWAAGTGTAQYGGSLHGTWTSEATVTSSDRRLKTAIAPLSQVLALRAGGSGTDGIEQPLTMTVGDSDDGLRRTQQSRSDAVSSLIRFLRPVAFRYKRASESKHSRFGFIAQELQAVLPDLVHEDSRNGMKSVRYNDLVAVLAVGLQSLSERLGWLEEDLQTLERDVDRRYVHVGERLSAIEMLVSKLLVGKAVFWETGDDLMQRRGGDPAMLSIDLEKQLVRGNDTNGSGRVVGMREVWNSVPLKREADDSPKKDHTAFGGVVVLDTATPADPKDEPMSGSNGTSAAPVSSQERHVHQQLPMSTSESASHADAAANGRDLQSRLSLSTDQRGQLKQRLVRRLRRWIGDSIRPQDAGP
jgi:hypothetical protein